MKYTINTKPEKIVARIKEIESQLKKTSDIAKRNALKSELKTLYKLRHKQKNYTPPPKKVSLKGF